jgi:molecular chaperone HtpG
MYTTAFLQKKLRLWGMPFWHNNVHRIPPQKRGLNWLMTTATRHEFQAETQQLLHLMINAIYSNKEIFLRELISNASDAIDKRQFEALTQPDLLPADYAPCIYLQKDADARTLSISDNGIGMTEEEVVRLIGTIAKSGTKEFAQALQANPNNPELIGQFGVGFYSSFIVADKVTLISRKAGETAATKWESTGDGAYTIESATREEAGTTITLHLKPADPEDKLEDFTQDWSIRRVVTQYSDFVAHPIQMDITRSDVAYDDEGKPKEDTRKDVTERQTLNSMKAIWTRPSSDVTEDEYNAFYQHISRDWNPPLKTITTRMEGTMEARALLFLPSKAPFDLFYRDAKHGIQLYVKRVFIMDQCTELMPTWLRFIKGVVDSEDLSLNISREILQQNRQVQQMRKHLVKKVLSTLEDLKQDDATAYNGFWQEFGRVLKEGLYEDRTQQDALLNLCLFASTHTTGDGVTSLGDYESRMKADQKAVYYLTGNDRAHVENSPHLEAFKAKGIEVLLLTDPIDELWLQSVSKYKDYELKNVGKGQSDLPEQNTEAVAEKAETHKDLLAKLKSVLAEQVKDVRFTSRLTDSPACLVGDTHDMTPQMVQIMKSMGQAVPDSKRILELNPDHPVLGRLQQVFSQRADDPLLSDYAELLLGQAQLSEGQLPAQPSRFSQLVARLMVG